MLGFRPDELFQIQSRPSLYSDAPTSWLSAMLSEWLQWTPGDRRGSITFATLEALKTALRGAGLEVTAHDLQDLPSGIDQEATLSKELLCRLGRLGEELFFLLSIIWGDHLHVALSIVNDRQVSMIIQVTAYLKSATYFSLSLYTLFSHYLNYCII